MSKKEVTKDSANKISLPSDRISVDVQFSVLKSLTFWYSKNKKPVSYKDIGGVQASKANVSSALQFYSKNNWLGSEKRGSFVPSEDLIQYFDGFDKSSAEKILAEKILNKPLGMKVSFFLKTKGKVVEDDLIKYIGSEFKLKKSHRPRIIKLIELLNKLGVIKKEKDEISLVVGIDTKRDVAENKVTENPKEEKVVIQPPNPQGKMEISSKPFIGILIDPNTPEEKIRKAVRIVLDECNKAG